MGVYIPNMEKPKDCEMCPFFVLDGAITDDNEWVSYSVCDLLSKTIGDADMMNDCPLIEIVTCGECTHRHEHEWYNTCDKHIGHGFEDDYFCKDGERNSKNNSNRI